MRRLSGVAFGKESPQQAKAERKRCGRKAKAASPQRSWRAVACLIKGLEPAKEEGRANLTSTRPAFGGR